MIIPAFFLFESAGVITTEILNEIEATLSEIHKGVRTMSDAPLNAIIGSVKAVLSEAAHELETVDMKAADTLERCWVQIEKLAYLGEAVEASWNRYDLSGAQYWTPDARIAFIKDVNQLMTDKNNKS